MRKIVSCYVTMKTLYKAFRLFVVGWITLTVATSGATGMVLCICSDGHVALEPAHQERYPGAGDWPGQDRNTLIESLAGSADEACGNCVDVSLSSDTLSLPITGPRNPLSLKTQLVHILPAPWCAGNETSIASDTRHVPRAAPLPAHISLLALRTVVLRI